MRTSIRSVWISAALGLGLALAACNQNTATTNEASSSSPSDQQREAQMASEQLAALGGPADAATRAAFAGDFQASGGVEGNADAGAWELRLLGDYAQFTRPGLGDDGGPTGPRDFRQHGMRVVAGDLTITISQEPCTTSGLQLPYTARVLFEGVNYQGCARKGVDEGPRATWASVLPDLIPAIDACLPHVSSKPGRVTYAGAVDDGQVSVRIREADGSRRECFADAAGTTVSSYDPVSDVDRRSGEGDPEFQRGGAEPAAQRCRTVEAAGSYGWLIHRSC
ncbi:MAG TPA: hypothetical protein VHC73_16235 [Vitreimonas sp.]|jgi:hypothetical protein|nr:hypothetical protein [Vitreimonas sp.]